MVFMVCATAERLRKEGNQENFYSLVMASHREAG
jgi:hypothetical protein